MDYEEEEIIIYTDFQQSILSVEELDDPNVNIKIIGIDKEHPLIIINSKIFKGKPLDPDLSFLYETNPIFLFQEHSIIPVEHMFSSVMMQSIQNEEHKMPFLINISIRITNLLKKPTKY